MAINEHCDLVLKDLYFYDFKSAYPRILQGIGWNFSDVDLDDKAQRNISIGTSQRDNQNLSEFLMNAVDSLLQFYIDDNDLDESDIIVTQRDGFIVTKMLKNTEDFLKLDFRGIVDLLIITPDRKKFLMSKEDTVEVKGISHKYSALDSVYQLYTKLNLYNKKSLFTQLEQIKNRVLKSDDKKLFMVEIDGKFVVQTLKHGQLIVANDNIFNMRDVNTQKYYDHYFRELSESVFLQFY